MTETLDLPNGETVTPGDVILYNDYPYRFSPVEEEAVAFELVPLYWGDSELDIPFRSHADFADQWEEGSRGTLTPEEWDDWLIEKRHDDRFGDEELDALRAELPAPDRPDGIVASIRRTLGLR